MVVTAGVEVVDGLLGVEVVVGCGAGFDDDFLGQYG